MSGAPYGPSRIRSYLVACAVVLLISSTLHAQFAKNVILMVADGSGFNSYNATSYYQYGATGAQPYEQPGWSRYACSTYPLNTSTTPTGSPNQNLSLIYTPAKAWNGLGAYNWLQTSYTDSAAAATALSSGVKTYNSAINWTNTNHPLTGQTIAERAKAAGRSVGTVSTVQWSHATPAALGGAHNISRDNYAAIANEMLNAPYLDVIMGAGHPSFDDNGQPAAGTAQYVGGTTTWNQLQNGTHPAGWSLVETKAGFEALTSGPTPNKVVGTAQVATTLQEERSGASPTDLPYSDPRNANVPTLGTMTKAALNVLDNNPDGLFLHVEGGAVDWANHDNVPGRMVEELSEFNAAVQDVVDWVGAHSSWDETLLIVTADHETGLLWGPNSNTTAFTDLVNNGAGSMPGLRYNASGHSNSLVPLFARGAGSDLFASLVDGYDATAAAHWGVGNYVDNTDVFRAMAAALPEPSTLALLSSFAFFAARRRRQTR